MSVVCDKGKGRPLGKLKATFSTALKVKVLQCSKTIMSYDQSQCVLLALCVCALGGGLTEKVLGLGQRRGGAVPPPPSEGGGVPPPYSPPNCRTPLGVTHWLAAAPVPFPHPWPPRRVPHSSPPAARPALAVTGGGTEFQKTCQAVEAIAVQLDLVANKIAQEPRNEYEEQNAYLCMEAELLVAEQKLEDGASLATKVPPPGVDYLV